MLVTPDLARPLARFLGALVVVLMVTSGAGAQPLDPVGHVRQLAGQVSLERGDDMVVPAVGDPVELGDVVMTGTNGTLGVTLLDGTRLAFGPNTRFHLEGFAFDPADSDFSLIGSILRGTLVYISGQLGRLAPESVQISTPTGTIGVRGTRFAVSADEGGS